MKNWCPQDRLLPDPGSKTVHGRDPRNNESDIYSSTEESVKEEKIVNGNNSKEKTGLENATGLEFKKPKALEYGLKNHQPAFLTKKSGAHSEKVLNPRKYQKL